MGKTCSRCGGEMALTLRNVIYKSRARIHNVPVHVCVNESCANSQVVDIVKEDLKRLVNELGTEPRPGDIRFDDLSEFTRLLVALDREGGNAALPQAVEDRVNELLDLFLLAQSLGDRQWVEDIRRRLTQMQLSMPLIEHIHTTGSH